MRKPVLYILLIAIGSVAGMGIYRLFQTPEKGPTVTVNPKEIKDHLRFLESSLDSMHDYKSNPVPGEWLFHNRELQQYPHQFLKEHPNILEEDRDKVYIQPIGSFSPKQAEIMDITAVYLSVYYNVQVSILDSMSTSEVPEKNRRMGLFEREQLQTTYIMDKMLKPNLPDDARAYMGFTSYDLYPNDDYNFVFGQGRIGGHVGIYSIARFGYPEWSEEEYTLCLKRTMKVASHELGHIFGFRHCVDYECIMNGSNSLDETDGKPVYLCPLDLLKVSQGLGIDEIYRFERLAEFWTQLGYMQEAEFYTTCANLLRENSNRREGGIHNN